MAQSSPKLRYEGKVTVVTGGSKGIGEGCVRVFVRNGSKVVFCARGEEAGKALADDMNKQGPGEAYFVPCDVTSEDDIKNLMNKTVEKYGRIDCLINNAGWHPPEQTIDEVTAQDFRDLFNLNVVSYFLASKYALPHLRKTQGNIINDSSLVGQIGQVGAVSYVATKFERGGRYYSVTVTENAKSRLYKYKDTFEQDHYILKAYPGAISAMSRALAVDEAQYSVRVNTFSPGNVWTPLWDNLASNSGVREAMIKGGEEAQLLGRMGTIEEAGELCLFLAAEGTFLTGVDIPLSGGAELNYGNKSRLKKKSNIYA